jgi:hypothetical protein
MVRNRMQVTKTIHPHVLFQKRVEVYWGQAGAKGWWKGTIVDYCPLSKVFFVKYDKKSTDGEDIYEEALLSPSMPQWRIL